ncbi:MAG TPA: hypothetical protein VHA12_01740 [Candidatus Nanoarchaeia archaeon]|nr:hypothetical protein [Candidatus Nanoarchaeia archaeon]
MVYQQTLTASEAPSEGILLRRLLLAHKTKLLHKGSIISDNFISDVEGFVERNLIHNKEVCSKCLKGFMISKAREHELSDSASKVVDKFLDEEAGHLGYYLDNDEVKPVRTI